MSSRDLPGVSAMSVYVPPFRVDLQDWCRWTDNSWEKISAVVGRSFRVCGRHENVYTMAANAVLRLIRQNDIDPTRVGFLGLGTESSTDNAAGAVIVRGMVDRALESLGLPRLSRHPSGGPTRPSAWPSTPEARHLAPSGACCRSRSGPLARPPTRARPWAARAGARSAPEGPGGLTVAPPS